MSQLALMPGIAPSYDSDASQWFTPPDLAHRLVRWCGSIMPKRVLEPSAGSGALIDAWINARKQNAWQLDAVELDEDWVGHLSDRYADEQRVTVIHDDFLTRRAEQYDFALLNPPYEDGKARRFLRTCMYRSEKVCGIFQTSILQGVENVESIWNDESWTWMIALLKRRPKFSGASGSAQRDFCCVKGRRTDPGERRAVKLEWWS